jgi:hypothetical protein
VVFPSRTHRVMIATCCRSLPEDADSTWLSSTAVSRTHLRTFEKEDGRIACVNACAARSSPTHRHTRVYKYGRNST